MNFSIPQDVKDYFDRTFAHNFKSALVARLVQEAIVQAERKARSDAAFMQILVVRQQAAKTSTETILQTRDALRAESDCARGLPPR